MKKIIVLLIFATLMCCESASKSSNTTDTTTTTVTTPTTPATVTTRTITAGVVPTALSGFSYQQNTSSSSSSIAKSSTRKKDEAVALGDFTYTTIVTPTIAEGVTADTSAGVKWLTFAGGIVNEYAAYAPTMYFLERLSFSSLTISEAYNILVNPLTRDNRARDEMWQVVFDKGTIWDITSVDDITTADLARINTQASYMLGLYRDDYGYTDLGTTELPSADNPTATVTLSNMANCNFNGVSMGVTAPNVYTTTLHLNILGVIRFTDGQVVMTRINKDYTVSTTIYGITSTSAVTASFSVDSSVYQ